MFTDNLNSHMRYRLQFKITYDLLVNNALLKYFVSINKKKNILFGFKCNLFISIFSGKIYIIGNKNIYYI